MSWLPLCNAFGAMFFIFGVFLWVLWSLFFFVFFSGILLLYLIKESMLSFVHYSSGFCLFIVSEVVAFGTLLFMCLCSEESGVFSISSFSELPLLGCFILGGSSVTATAYHHNLGSFSSRYFLLFTIFLGCCFIGLQLVEFYDCGCDLSFCVYQASCFCTVGLHFLHVLGGVLALFVLFLIGEDFISGSTLDFIVWYWHFVDYVWLLVYLVVYVS
uniref:Cytochrome c oxidase subunit 3 n=1 Tax=Uvitellina sp. SSS-2019 TaxID=2587434 RepID=A0A4Y5RCQ4_9TREM|nr:cytochrome c oxidase subunit III [Uvitellina sp. SSS-2019]QCY72811.1 cytochrome c oxidase subunit 3 [Uvitellina sp. SSS-2019]